MCLEFANGNPPFLNGKRKKPKVVKRADTTSQTGGRKVLSRFGQLQKITVKLSYNVFKVQSVKE